MPHIFIMIKRHRGLSKAKELLISPCNTSRKSNVIKCKKDPIEIREELLSYQEGVKKAKTQLNYAICGECG